MLLGISICGYNDGAIFETTLFFNSYYSLQMENMIADSIYATQDITASNSTVKPTSWYSQDVVYCDFNGILEGGSVSGSGKTITSLYVKKRNTNGLSWDLVAMIPYVAGSAVLFQYDDNYVQNGSEYEYVLIPFVNDVQGVVAPNSTYIVANFEGTFITDKTYNYALMYNANTSNIVNNVSSYVFEPLDSQYPIVQFGDLNYKTGKITATLISDTTLNSSEYINIGQETMLRQQITNFLNNKQPKLLRTKEGDLILVVISDKVNVSFQNNSIPIAIVSFSFTEIGATDSTTLTKFGL